MLTPTRSRRSPLISASLLCVLGLLPAACSQTRTAGPAFPETMTQTEVLDIQVLRDGPTITITNPTSRSFGPSRLWVNRWYSHPIDGFAPGQTIELSLSDFVDINGDTFQGGGFFAADEPEQLAQMQIEENAVFYGLIVVSQGDD